MYIPNDDAKKYPLTSVEYNQWVKRLDTQLYDEPISINAPKVGQLTIKKVIPIKINKTAQCPLLPWNVFISYYTRLSASLSNIIVTQIKASHTEDERVLNSFQQVQQNFQQFIVLVIQLVRIFSPESFRSRQIMDIEYVDILTREKLSGTVILTAG